MSITTGVFARIGPWPSSCGSTAWSPGAQIVWEGRKPSAIIRVLTTERRSSAVSLRPSRHSQPLRIRQDLSASIPASRPASAARSDASIARTSCGLLDLALRPEGVGPEVEADPARVELHGEAEREALRHLHAAQAELLQGERDDVRGGRLAAVLLQRRGDLRPRHHAVDARLVARAVHLQVAHDQDAGLPLLDEEERIGREEPGRVEDVGVRLGRGVEESAGGRLLHGA